MIPFLAPLLLRFPLLGKLPWKWIGAVAVVLLAWLSVRQYADRVADRREAEIRALWAEDTAARDKASAEAIAKAEAQKAAALANNAEVMSDANAKLVAIAGERDSLVSLLNNSRDQIRRISAAEATSRLGADVIAGIAARAAEVDRRLADYDAACQRDAVRFQALQDQIRPQMQ